MKERRILAILVFYVPLILAMAAWLAFWSQRLRDVQAELALLRQQQALQETLQPFLSELAKRSTEATPGDLFVPPSRPLPARELVELPRLLASLAGGPGITVTRAMPRAGDLGPAYDRIPVDIVVDGDLASQRDLLLALCRLPALHELFEVRLERLTGRQMRMTLLLTLKVS